ncbi:MAG: hypothetical protein QOI35_3862, partial [Cryptosporangiaceae bacterium]|nr:hypothetical protein [Cryptosporangiaceae bacterium]
MTVSAATVPGRRLAAAPGLGAARALHAEGVTATAQNRPRAAARLLRGALGALPGDPPDGLDLAGDAAELRGRILVSLAHAEAEQGHVVEGLALLGEAEPLLPPARRGVLRGQRGLLLLRTGQAPDALREFDGAVALLRGGAEPRELARILLNRSVVHLLAGRIAAARTDLRRCAALAVRDGDARIAAKASHNLGYLAFLAGDLPGALRAFDTVAAAYAVHAPAVLPVLALDKARALLAAGLYRYADAELAAALAEFRRHRLSQDHAEALLARAGTALLAGRPAAARQWARQARARFARRGNETWTALASLLVARAELAAGPGPRRAAAIAAQAGPLAAALHAHGLREDALTAALIHARALAMAGDRAAGAAVLAAAGPPPPGGRLEVRLLWREVRAELAAGPPERARELRSGLAELRRHTSQLGAADLQTGCAVHGQALASAGLAAALPGGSPAVVFGWAERARAQAMLLPPVRPPEDPRAAAALEELRHARLAARDAELAGRPSAALRARCTALERTIREHAWFAAGPGRSAPVASFTQV